MRRRHWPAPSPARIAVSGSWPQGDGTDHPILGRDLGPVHRLRPCRHFIVHGRDADTIDGARRQTVNPCGLTSPHRQGVRLADGTIRNQRMIGDRGDRRGERGPCAATACLRINGRALIHTEITRGGADAIAGEGSRPCHRNRIGAYTGSRQIPEFCPEGTAPIGAQIGADFRERKSIGGHGGHGDLACHRIPCLRADGEESVRAVPDRMGPTDRIGRVARCGTAHGIEGNRCGRGRPESAHREAADLGIGHGPSSRT